MPDSTLRIDLLVPIFNDSSKLPNFFQEFLRIREMLKSKLELTLVMVDDGSQDDSVAEISKYGHLHKGITLIELSRNFGKEAALFAGISNSNADALILLDVDLQDPIDLVPRLVESWMTTGCDTVIARRSQNRNAENGLRRKISRLYLGIFNKLSSIQIDANVGETRLIDAKMISAFKQLEESSRFTRGLLHWLGFKTEFIEFDRLNSPEKSRFGFKRLIKLAIDGITSFSIKPLRLVTILGFLGSATSVILGLVVVLLRVFEVVSIPGYSSTIIVILFGSSIQLFSMGILGEYIGKNLEESKKRPVFIARNVFKF